MILNQVLCQGSHSREIVHRDVAEGILVGWLRNLHHRNAPGNVLEDVVWHRSREHCQSIHPTRDVGDDCLSADMTAPPIINAYPRRQHSNSTPRCTSSTYSGNSRKPSFGSSWDALAPASVSTAGTPTA